MSRSLIVRNRQERDALAARLRELSDQLEQLADRHCELLSFEGYTGLGENAAELKAVIRVLQADDLHAVVQTLMDEARDHIACIEEAFDKEGAV